MELAKTEANDWKIKRDNLKYGKKKTRAPLSDSGKITRKNDKDESYFNEDNGNANSSNSLLGGKERNAMEELTKPVTVDVSGVPSLEAITQLMDQMVDDADIADGSE